MGQTTGVLVNVQYTKDTNTNKLACLNYIIMDEAEDYEEWIRITLTQYDKEVTKAMVKEEASLPKKLCKECNRIRVVFKYNT
jgi:Zn-finger domain-containing protein